jgi:hypothetical protein
MPLYKQQSSFIQSYITRHTGIGGASEPVFRSFDFFAFISHNYICIHARARHHYLLSSLPLSRTVPHSPPAAPVAEAAPAAPLSRIPGPSAGPADSFSNPTAANYMERLRALTTRPAGLAPAPAAPVAAVPAAAMPSAIVERPLEPELPEVR